MSPQFWCALFCIQSFVSLVLLLVALVFRREARRNYEHYCQCQSAMARMAEVIERADEVTIQ